MRCFFGVHDWSYWTFLQETVRGGTGVWSYESVWDFAVRKCLRCGHENEIELVRPGDLRAAR